MLTMQSHLVMMVAFLKRHFSDRSFRYCIHDDLSWTIQEFTYVGLGEGAEWTDVDFGERLDGLDKYIRPPEVSDG